MARSQFLYRPEPGPAFPLAPPGMDTHLEFTLENDGPAVLLIHGFADTAAVNFPFGQLLHAEGMHVRGITLPGHGSTLIDFAAVTPEELYAGAAQELRQLRATHDQVFVFGFSMGGLVALRCAADGLADGVATLASPVWLMKGPWSSLAMKGFVHAAAPLLWAIDKGEESSVSDKTLRAYEINYMYYPLQALQWMHALMSNVLQDCSRVRVPACICHATHDDVIAPHSAPALLDALAHVEPTEFLCENSRHKIVIDHDRKALAHALTAFVYDTAGKPTSQVV